MPEEKKPQENKDTIGENFRKVGKQVADISKLKFAYEQPQHTFTKTLYAKNLKAFEEKLALEMKERKLDMESEETKAVLNEIKQINTKASEIYAAAATPTTPPFDWGSKEAEWAAQFATTKTRLDALIPTAPVGGALTADEEKTKAFIVSKQNELKGYEEKEFNNAIFGLERSLNSQKEKAIPFDLAYKIGLESGYGGNLKHVFKGVIEPQHKETAEEIRRRGILVADAEDGYLQDLKKLREYTGDDKGVKEYVGQTPPYKDTIFEESKWGYRPKPLTLREGLDPRVNKAPYAAAYGGAIELLRFMHPTCTEMFYTIPKLAETSTKPAPDMSFINEKYILNKLIPVFEEAKKRGMTMRLSPATEHYLRAYQAKIKDGRVSFKGATGKALDEFFALQQSMVDKPTLDKDFADTVGKGMRETVDDLSSKISTGLDEEHSTAYKMERENRLNDVMADNAILPVDKEAAMEGAKNAAALASGLQEVVLPLAPAGREGERGFYTANSVGDPNAQVNNMELFNEKATQIESEMQHITEANVAIEAQMTTIKDMIATENANGFQNGRNPFLLEQHAELEKLLEVQQAKLFELEGKARVLSGAVQREDFSGRQAEQTTLTDRVVGLVRNIAAQFARSDAQVDNFKGFNAERDQEKLEAKEESEKLHRKPK